MCQKTHLSASDTSKLVEEALPFLSPVDQENLRTLAVVKRVSEGGHHSSWFVGSEHIIRARTTDENDNSLEGGIRLRSLLREFMGNNVDADIRFLTNSIPESIHVSNFNKGYEQQKVSYSLDRRLFGCSLEATSCNENTVQDLQALMRVQKTRETINAAEALNLPILQRPQMETIRTSALDALKTLRRNGQLHDLLIDEVDLNIENTSGTKPNRVANDSDEQVLLHADFKGEHFLLSPDGHISGILDWSDAAMGPVYVDIAGLAISVGSALAVEIAVSAGYTFETCMKGISLARYNTLILLDDRLNGNDDQSPINLLRRQMARAFEPVLP